MPSDGWWIPGAKVPIDYVGARDDRAHSGGIEWARRHHDTVAYFGRFPHRNAMLGRENSVEEAAFLLTPDSRFSVCEPKRSSWRRA